jgi:SulP family sulfate permease
MLIPQGIAYAMIAGLPPIYGLYTALIPPAVYTFFGTSRQMSIGPAAMDSLIVGAGLSTLAAIGSEHFVVFAIVLAFFVGLFQLIFGLFRMGFVVNFLSRPVISGFTSGSAIIIASNQIGNLLGLDMKRNNHIQDLFFDFIHALKDIHWITAVIGIFSILILILLKKYAPKLPGALIVVVLGTLIAFAFQLNTIGVHVIGNIPQGLPSFKIPHINQSNFKELSTLALTLALIGFMEAISVAKTMETKHNNYKVKPNQELAALGFANMIGSFFQTYPATAGMARTAVNDQAGAKTPLAGLFASILIGLTLLFLTPVFYYLPIAVLAAIIIVAAYGLLDFKLPNKLLGFSRRDLVLLTITLLTTVFLGIKEGILAGIVISLGMLIYKSTKPHIAVLGRVPNTNFYRTVERFNHLEVSDDILIVRLDAQLYFVNTTFFKDKVQAFAEEKGNKLKLIVLVFESVNDLDSSAIYALEEIHDFFSNKGIIIALTGIKGPVRDTLAKSGLMKKIRYDHCFMNVQEALDSYSKNTLSKPLQYSYQEFIKQINR